MKPCSNLCFMCHDDNNLIIKSSNENVGNKLATLKGELTTVC